MISSHHLLGGLAVAYRKTKTSSRNSLYLRLLCATLIHHMEIIRSAAAIVAFVVRVASIAAAAFVTVTTTFAAAFTVARAHFASVARRWR